MSTDAGRSLARRPGAWLSEPLPQVAISFEFFPPKNAEADARLWQAIERLAPFRPSYVSVTCGAGGNPAEGTASLVEALRARAGLCAVAHLTCATAPRATIDQIAERYWDSGVRHIVALRGDPPKDGVQRQNGAHYGFAADLVAALRRIGDFEISVAAYPEPHPEAASPEADFDNLKRKIDAGAGRAITQYCFDTDAVLRLRDRMVAAGITAPLSVGILPVHNFTQVRRFSERCGAGVPDWLRRSVRRAGRRSRAAGAGRRQRGRRAGPPPDRRGHRGAALLYPQSRRAHDRGLPAARPAPLARVRRLRPARS